MHCPFCHSPNSRVVDTRIADDGASIRRRRECISCKRRFTTLETSTFQVVKRSGVVEPFSREKVVAGVIRASKGRPVTDDQLALLGQQVEEELRSTGVSNVSTEEVGRAILPFLRDLDVVAYLRFASVYSQFNSLEDFEDAVTKLKNEREAADPASGAQEEHEDEGTTSTRGRRAAPATKTPKKSASRSRKRPAKGQEVAETFPGT